MDDERSKQEWLREVEEKRDKEKKSHLGRGSWRNDDREIDSDKAIVGPVRFTFLIEDLGLGLGGVMGLQH